jgi:hypothetical protein
MDAVANAVADKRQNRIFDSCFYCKLQMTERKKVKKRLQEDTDDTMTLN